MDRFSWRAARAWFEAAFPDSMLRVAVLRFLSEAVGHADNGRRDNWAVVAEPERIRLAVGSVNVLTISQETIRLLYLEGIASRDVEKHRDVICHHHVPEEEMIPHCAACEFPSAVAGMILPVALTSHLHLISLASETPRVVDVAEEHSAGVVDYLNEYLLGFLRQPPSVTAAKH